MKAPSFAPWLSRVRVIRGWVTLFGFAGGAWTSHSVGFPWDESVIRGLAAAVPSFFVGWVAGLWLCTLLHRGQINRIRRVLIIREQQRAADLRDMYERQGAAVPEALREAA